LSSLFFGESWLRGIASALIGGSVVAGVLQWLLGSPFGGGVVGISYGWLFGAGTLGVGGGLFFNKVLRWWSSERFLKGREVMQEPAALKGADAPEVESLLATLENERDRLRSVLEGMDSAVLALDPSRRILLANRATSLLLGLGEDPVGKQLEDILDVPELKELFSGLSSDEGDVEFELGEPARMFLGRLTGTASGGVLVVHDVTASKKLDKVRRDFVANVSHELRTPVAVIQANAETLLGGALSDEEQSVLFVEGILRNARRLSNLISDLLDLTRIESGKFEIQTDEIDLGRLVNRVWSMVESRAGEKGVSLQSVIPSDTGVIADAKALEQILVNYIENAIKYGPEGGLIRVGVSLHPRYYRVEVADEGDGIEPPHRDRVFERFYRVDKGRSRYTGGTGLGLSIVKHLAGAMGGRVGLDCPLEGGSTFWVELPRGGIWLRES